GVVFMLLEDEHGQVNLIVPPPIYERFRAAVRGEPLLLVEGRFERLGRNENLLVSALRSLGPLAAGPGTWQLMAAAFLAMLAATTAFSGRPVITTQAGASAVLVVALHQPGAAPGRLID